MLPCKIMVFQLNGSLTVNQSEMLDNLFKERYIDIYFDSVEVMSAFRLICAIYCSLMKYTSSSNK